MILVEAVLGNTGSEEWRHKLDGATVELVSLDQWQAQKTRFRTTTGAGTEIAVSLERHAHLHNGDVLHWDESARCAIVASIELQDVMVIQLNALQRSDPETLARTCVELGHALGNQHWPAVVKGTSVYVPLTVDRKVMASVMKTHAFEGVTYEFVPGAEVIPFLAPHESRRLFGGADSTPHSHAHAGDHAHPHEGRHSH